MDFDPAVDRAVLWRPLYGEDGHELEGVAFLAASSASPKLEFWAIRADLANPRIRIITGPAPGGGQNTVSAVKVSSFVRDYGCMAAINANPFEPSSSREGEQRTVVGLVVSDGKALFPPDSRYDALAVYDSGTPRAAVLGQENVSAATRTVLQAAGGFYAVLKDGMVTDRAASARGNVRHPRSAAGVSADVLYLLVIDGRRPGSAGATEEETAVILKRLGASDGLCFDGGGSSALALGGGVFLPDRKTPQFLPGAKGRGKLLNRPIHGGIPGTERAVGTCLGIIYERESKPD